MTLALDTTLPQHLPADDQERLTVMGQRLTVRVTPAQTGGACLVFEDLADAGMGVPSHVHDHEDELFLVRRGSVRFEVDGRSILAGPGDTVFGPRGVPHSWFVEGDETAEMTIAILPGKLEAMFRELGALGPDDAARIAPICATHGVRFA